jgi:hypothetical protein
MLSWRRCWIAMAAAALLGMALARHSGAQEQESVAATQGPDPALLPNASPLVSLASIPVPYDPMELVTGNAQLADSAEERAATIDLLAKSRRLSNVRLHAYDLKTSFTSYGSSSSDGPWILEDTSPAAGLYRWTAEGPGFSGVFLTANKLVSSNQPGGAMPLRLAQVRDAMWGIYYPEIGPHATLRVANGDLNGAGLRCVLVANGFYGKKEPEFSSGRSFAEAEYCVNPQTGLLETYSPYAGLYIRYDYANALHFHEQIIPDGFTIAERGKTVIEGKTDSVDDAPPANSNLFEPAGLNPLGVGQVIELPMRVRGIQMASSPDANVAGQVVVVHGMLSPDGHLSEVEVLASTNPSLEDVAVDHANKAYALRTSVNTQPGVTPRSREIVFTLEFVPRPAPRPRPLPPGFSQ